LELLWISGFCVEGGLQRRIERMLKVDAVKVRRGGDADADKPG